MKSLQSAELIVVPSVMATANYVLSLCDAVHEHPRVSFGIAVRVGLQSSLNVEASKVIHSLVTFSPAPESVSEEFLNELRKVHGIAPLGNLSIACLSTSGSRLIE
jgi:hypothetical protein